jgi:drug/metabolite transporter (DMT)-like permease
MKATKISTESWLIFFALTLIWGSAFILMKKGLESFSPWQVASLRICFAGLVLLPVGIRNIRKVSKNAVLHSFLFGLTNAGIPAFLFPLAETKVDSSTAGILNGLTPIFTLTVGISFFGVAHNAFKLAGVVIGFIGAATLIFFREGFDKVPQLHDAQVGMMLLLVFATLLYGFAANIMKRHLDSVAAPVIASIAFGSFTLPCALYLAFSDFGHRMVTNPVALTSLGYNAVLGVVGSAVAVMFQSRLLKQTNALFGSFTTYLCPFVAILWGLAVDERIGIVPFVSLGIILAGIYVSRLTPVDVGRVTKPVRAGADTHDELRARQVGSGDVADAAGRQE